MFYHSSDLIVYFVLSNYNPIQLTQNRTLLMKNKILLFSLLFSASVASAQNYQVPVSEQDEPMMTGKFEPTWQSLENYQVPEWFRNVKFGIWAHWGPQCVEGSGDWMARSLYMEGSNEYNST